jgi:hypothetical protein
MSEKKRPNVTGKGPALTREMLEVFKEIEAGAGSLSGEAAGKINSALSEKAAELGKIIKMAYLKTVKAGEIAWDCKEMALELKESVTSGQEDKAVEILGKLTTELDDFIHKIKTFVVRMT